MNRLALIAFLAVTASSSFAQTSFAQFSQRGSSASGALQTLKSYNPFPHGLGFFSEAKNISLDASLFAGYDTVSNSGVAAFVGALTYSVQSGYYASAGIGNRMDMSKSFTFSEISWNNAGWVVAVGKRF